MQLAGTPRAAGTMRRRPGHSDSAARPLRLAAVLSVTLLAVAALVAGCTLDGPQLVSTTPGAGSAGVPVSTAIPVRFDRAMDESSLPKAVVLTPAPPGGVELAMGDGLTAVELILRGPLKPDTAYTLTISREARDKDGRRLRKPTAVTWRTAPARQVACSWPVWSPDGSRLAWLEDAADGRTLWTANADGTGIRRLASGVWPESKATWAPDGTGLIVAVIAGSGEGNRAVLELISLQPDVLAEPLALNSALVNPGKLTVTFSPDGSRMAVQNNMYMVDAHSDFYRQLGVAQADGTSIAFFGNLLVGWGPDGSSLIFLDMPGIGEAHDFDYDIWRYTLSNQAKTLVGAAGNVKNLGSVARLPSGTHCVFADWIAEDVKTADGWEITRLPRDLWTMTSDGTSVTRLTADCGHNADPSPAPGGKVAFASDRGEGTSTGDWDIWLLDAPVPGARATNLTRRAGYDGQPSFSPDGSLIAYVSDATGSREVWVMVYDSGQTRVISGIEGSAGP